MPWNELPEWSSRRACSDRSSSLSCSQDGITEATAKSSPCPGDIGGPLDQGARLTFGAVRGHRPPRSPLLMGQSVAEDWGRGEPGSKVGAEFLSDVIATAYEHNSVVVTTNLPFENRAEVLGNERLTSAAFDRLTHRCHILETKGESHRLQEAKRRRRKPCLASQRPRHRPFARKSLPSRAAKLGRPAPQFRTAVNTPRSRCRGPRRTALFAERNTVSQLVPNDRAVSCRLERHARCDRNHWKLFVGADRPTFSRLRTRVESVAEALPADTIV